MADKILRPYARAQYSNARRRFEVRHQQGGWYEYFDFADMAKEGMLRLPIITADTMDITIDPHVAIGVASRDIPLMKLVDNGPVRGLTLHPFIADMDYEVSGDTACKHFYTFRCRTYQGGVTGWQTLAGSVKGHADFDTFWDFKKSADGQFVEMVQKASVVNDLPVQTEVELSQVGGTCPNAWFTFGVRRQAISEDAQTFLDENPDAILETPDLVCTTAWFGGMTSTLYPFVPAGERWWAWGLRIPIQGRPYLIRGRLTWGQWDRDGVSGWDWGWTYHREDFDGGNLSETNAQQMALQGKTYMVGVIGTHLVVSDAQMQDFAYKTVRDAQQPIVPAGDIAVTNFPGQCALWLAPVQFTPVDDMPGGTDAPAITMANYWVTHEPFRPNLTSRYGYGFTLQGWEQPTARYVWQEAAPAWWPAGADWPPVDARPPGRDWGWAPRGWPSDEAWPPMTTQSDQYVVMQDVDDDALWWTGTPVYEEEERDVTRPPWDYVEAETTYEAIEGGAIGFEYVPIGDGPPYPALNWRITMEQVRHYDASTAPLATYSTPYLQALALWQYPLITDNGNPTYSNLPIPHMVRAQRGIGQESETLLELATSNQIIPGPGGQDMIPFYEVREGAAVKVQVGVTLDTTPATVVSHHLGEFVAVERNATTPEAGFVLATWLQMLQLDRWIDGNLNLREWATADALLFLLKHVGLVDGYSRDEETGLITGDWVALENIGTALIDNTDHGKAWEWRKGATIGEILQDIAYRGQRRAFLWCGYGEETPTPLWKVRSGCRYCLTPRTEDDWLEHGNNGWNSSGCVAADIERTGNDWGVDFYVVQHPRYNTDTLIIGQEVQVESTALRSGEFATRVCVLGQTATGWPLQATVKWGTMEGPTAAPDSRYIGWRIAHVQEEDELQTRDAIMDRALDISHQMSRLPMNCSRIVLPLAATEDKIRNAGALLMREGHVIGMAGGRGVATHGRKFRVVNVQHNPDQMQTVVFARRMMGPYG
jgi:hypothetical protein